MGRNQSFKTINIFLISRNFLVTLVLSFVLSAGITDEATAESQSETPPLSSPASPRSDGAEYLRIPQEGSLQNPAWSPDSGELLYTAFSGGYNTEPAELYIYNTAYSRNRILVSRKGNNISLPGASWNRITDHVVFSSARDPHDEIYTIYAHGPANKEWQITDRSNLMSYEPSLSPEGEWIVFESHPLEEEENGIITRYKIDESQPYQTLTHENEDCRQPNWSPAGNLILYQKLENGRWDIWTTTPDGHNHRRITSGEGNKTDASFSPDGKWIVYSSDEGYLEYANLFIISSEGGSPTRLTQNDGYDGAPSWSPDGRFIAFESSPDNPDQSGKTNLWKIAVPSQFTTKHLFTGDFETGDFSQWYSVSWNQKRPINEQLQIVTSPVRQGQYAARFTVHDGDRFMNTSGERAQMDRPGPNEHEGDEYWYAWSTLFPEGWQAPEKWQVIIDWHASADYGKICQPLQLEINDDNSIGAKMLAGDVTGYHCFSGSGTAVSQSEIIVDKITTDVWNDFIIHVRWTTSDNGLIEIWHKLEKEPSFNKVINWEGIPTLQYKGDPEKPDVPYLLLANYRDTSNKHTSVLYHDGFRMADSEAALAVETSP